MGDVTFLHDSNGLVLGPDEPRPDLTIVVVNDDGGSIFAMLEQGAPEHAHAFERLFGTPHGVDLALAVRGDPDAALAGRQPRRARARAGQPQRRHRGRRGRRRPAGPPRLSTSGSARSGLMAVTERIRVEITLLLCGMAVAVLAGTAVADRFDFPAPLLLVVVGVAASYVPQVPQIYLSEEVVLFGLLPPLLYAAAQSTSLVDFRANRRAILLLSVGLVVFTAAGVAVVAKLLLPDLLLGAGVRDRRGGRAARRRGRHRDRPADRAAPADHHDPRGRVAAQRRDRAGGAAHGPGRRGRDRARPARTSAWTSCSPPVAACSSASALRVRRRQAPLLPRQGPGARRRDVAGRAVRGVRRRRGGPRLRRPRGRRRRPDPRSQGADRADRAVPDRRAPQLADDRVPAREHGVPAHRPAGLVDRRGRRRQRSRHRPDRRALRGHARRRASCCGSPGSSRHAT